MARPLYRMGTRDRNPRHMPGARWQTAAGHATSAQPPPAAAVRGAVGREARGGRAARARLQAVDASLSASALEGDSVPHPRPGACGG